MKIYVVEYETDEYKNKPVVMKEGQKAINYIENAFDNTLKDINYNMINYYDIDNFEGEAGIESEDGTEFYRWRLTEHNV